jgi:hypothetical protein
LKFLDRNRFGTFSNITKALVSLFQLLLRVVVSAHCRILNLYLKVVKKSPQHQTENEKCIDIHESEKPLIAGTGGTFCSSSSRFVNHIVPQFGVPLARFYVFLSTRPNAPSFFSTTLSVWNTSSSTPYCEEYRAASPLSQKGLPVLAFGRLRKTEVMLHQELI